MTTMRGDDDDDYEDYVVDDFDDEDWNLYF